MTYAGFILQFLILPIGVVICGIWLMRKLGHLKTVDLGYHWRGVAILAVIAFIWTTPWDNYLIARGVWDSPSDRIIGRVFYVPIEEYVFFILMPVLNGAVICCLLDYLPETSSTWRVLQRRARAGAAVVAGLLFGGGLYALRHEGGTYLGLILVWLTPPLLIQWLFDPAALVRAKGMVFMGTALPTIYFGFVDHHAIREGIWVIDKASTTGWGLPHLPLEELLFFMVTSLLLAQGMVLWHSIRPPPPDS